MERNHKSLLMAIIFLLVAGFAIQISRSGRRYYKVTRGGTLIVYRKIGEAG